MRTPITSLFALAFFGLALTIYSSAAAAPKILALKGATIYVRPTSPAIPNGVILIEDGRIAAIGAAGDVPVPRGAQTLDCSDFVITAGLWNSHVHFFERKWADAASIPADELTEQLADMTSRFGFTSVFDVSSDWQNTKSLRNRIELGEIDGPRIRSTGEGLIAPDALPPRQVLNIMGLMNSPLPEVTDLEQMRAVMGALLGDGADGIKLFAPRRGGAAMPDGAIEAAVAESHGRGKPLFLHPNSGDDVVAGLKAGADIIGHTTPHAGPWDAAVFAAIGERRAALTPTLSLWTYYTRHDRASAQKAIAETAKAQLRGWIASGGVVLFGTDLGANQYDPTREYELMAEAGMRFPEILASLTTAPAEFFGESDRLGTLDVGREADLVILGSDPAQQISALADVRYTLRSGKIIYASLAAHN